MDRRFVTLAAALLALAAGVSAGRAEDWPQWRGVDRSGHVAAGAKVPARLPDEPKIVWRVKVGEGFASPVVASGNVYLFDNQKARETLRALNAETGDELWRADVDETFQDEQGPPGPRCTPVADGDLVFAQSGKGELQCLRVADGQRVWRVNFLKDYGAAFLGEDSKVWGAAEHGYTASPLIVGDRLIACPGGTNGAGIVCFEKHTGHQLWSSQNDLASYSAPVAATLGGVRQAVCFSVEGVIGLGLEDGKLLWRFPLKTQYGRNCATPVIVDDWVVVGSYQAGMVGLRITRGEHGLKAERRWVNKEAALNFSSPVAADHHLYGLGPSKNIFCADLETGKIAWSKQGYIMTSGDVAHASFLVMGQNLLLSTDGGEIALIAVDATQCREISRGQVCGKNWCDPSYASGRLYTRDGVTGPGTLSCVELAP
jgi:outer membrane protein assembly factor BamB